MSAQQTHVEGFPILSISDAKFRLESQAAEITQLERQLAKVIKAAEAYLRASQPSYRLGSGAVCTALQDAIETAKGHLA